MTRVIRSAALATLALCVAVIAGCGDTAANNTYVDAVNKAQNDFAAAISGLQDDAAKATGPDGARKVFDNLGAEIDTVVADLQAIQAPDEVADLHEQLVDQVSQFGTSVDTAAESLTSNDPQKLTEAQAEFSREVSEVGTQISGTIAEINKKLQE